MRRRTRSSQVPVMRRGGQWEPLFLAALERCGGIADSARASGISRRAAYSRRDRDPEFRAAWDRALDVARSHRIVERTWRSEGEPRQLAARVSSVRHALARQGLGALADELLEVELLLGRQARALSQARKRARTPEGAR
jgi:hypothetical protein